MMAPLITIIIIAIVALTAWIMNKKGTKSKNYYSKKVSWFLGGYIALLVFCMVLVTALPNRDMVQRKMVKEGDLEKESTALYNSALEGKIDKTGKKYLTKRWSFEYQDRKLNIAVENHESFNTGIVVERKNTNDNKIEAVYYKSRSSINGIEVTGRIKPIDIKLARNTLTITKQSMVKIQFSQFENVFSINQFTGGKMFYHESNFYEGQSILYLRIPKKLELNNQSEMNLELVK